MGRTYKTEAFVLRARSGSGRPTESCTCTRSIADGWVPSRRGFARDESRFGARLEPFSHVELMPPGLREAAHRHRRIARGPAPARERGSVPAFRRPRRRRGDAALYVEEERNERAFEALTRFFEALDSLPAGLKVARLLDPLALAFRAPPSCSGSRATCPSGGMSSAGDEALVATSRARAVPYARRARRARRSCSPEGLPRHSRTLWTPLAEAHGLGLGERAVRDVLAVVVATYEFHGGLAPHARGLFVSGARRSMERETELDPGRV